MLHIVITVEGAAFAVESHDDEEAARGHCAHRMRSVAVRASAPDGIVLGRYYRAGSPEVDVLRALHDALRPTVPPAQCPRCCGTDAALRR